MAITILKTYPYQNLRLKDMEGEIWKELPGLEGYCMVSNLGRVKALARIIYKKGGVVAILKEKIVKQYLQKSKRPNLNGDYNQVLNFSIMIEGVIFSMPASRAIHSAFIKRLDFKKDRLCVLHHDDNALNNTVENLFATTTQELVKYTLLMGKNKAPDSRSYSKEIKQRVKEKLAVPVSQYDKNGNFICSYESLLDATRATGASSTAIKRVLSGKAKHAKGFIWYKGSKVKLSPEFIAKHDGIIIDYAKKAVRQYDLNGNCIVIYPSIVQAAKETGINRALLQRSLISKKSTKGYYWSYDLGERPAGAKIISMPPQLYTTSKMVKQYDLQGNYLATHNSVSAAVRAVAGLNRSTLIVRLNRAIENSELGGYLWQFGKP